MKKKIKLGLFVAWVILSQVAVGFLFSTYEIVGWDWCVEQGHPFTNYGYSFGFPFSFARVGLTYGCLTTPHTTVNFNVFGLFANGCLWFLIAVVLWEYRWKHNDE